MARGRSPERNKAFEMYKKNKGNITNREIANKLSVSEKTIAGWKCKDKWVDNLNGVLQKNTEYSKKIRSTPKEENNRRITKEKSVEKEVIRNTEINDKQRLFCLYYIEDFNATMAYKKAYECKYTTALVNGTRLLGNARVKAEIAILTEECLKEEHIETKLLCKKVFKKYINIAFSDITDYLTFGQKEIEKETDSGEVETFNVNYVDFKNSTEVDGTLISEIKQGRDGVGIKLQDKMKALDFLSKHLGLLDLATKEKINLTKEKLKNEIENEISKINIAKEKNNIAREKFEYEKTKLEEVEEENDGSLKEMLEGFKTE